MLTLLQTRFLNRIVMDQCGCSETFLRFPFALNTFFFARHNDLLCIFFSKHTTARLLGFRGRPFYYRCKFYKGVEARLLDSSFLYCVGAMTMIGGLGKTGA